MLQADVLSYSELYKNKFSKLILHKFNDHTSEKIFMEINVLNLSAHNSYYLRNIY